MTNILIYTPKRSPRISYIFDLIFNQILGISTISFTIDLDLFVQKEGVAKLNYSQHFIANIPYFYAHDLLYETTIQENFRPTFKKHQQHTAAFFHLPHSNNQQSLLPFDPFALAFYLVSRYEEYQPFTPDQHGRFPATTSVAYQEGFLQEPLVNHWALILKKYLLQYYPALHFSSLSYQYTPTYDIDHAYAFLNKGLLRQVGALGSNLLQRKGESLTLQFKTWFRLQQDPFDTFQYLQQLDEKFNLNPIYFWLLGDYGAYDKNIHYSNRSFQQLIQKNTQDHVFGIHPSYGSNQHPDRLKNEIQRLEQISQQRPSKSRQHFLILKFPNTYQALDQFAIREDYSMGYARHLGFRASIANPFLWYNLKEERCTKLTIFPFQLMDVTFNSYHKSAPEAVLEQALPIINATKAVDGHLISIWHNSSLSEAWEWKGWRAVYEAILQAAQ